jgi:hypothetical protein
MSETLEIGIEESVDFGKEAASMAANPKESSVSDNELNNAGTGDDGEGTEYREAEEQAQAEEVNGAQQNVYAKTAKGIMTTENTLTPRLLAHLNQDDIGRYKLTKPEVEDLAEALAPCLEHEGWSADNPWVYFSIQYFSYRGIQYFEGRTEKLKRQKAEDITPRPVDTDADYKKYEAPPQEEITPEQLKAELIAKGVRFCNRDGCEKQLEGSQTKYCNPSHRSQQVQINKKKAAE